MPIARSLAELIHHPTAQKALDREKDITETIDDTLDKWKVNLWDRNPAPAYTEGIDGEPIYTGTDLDEFSVLLALAERQAIVTLPGYTQIRKRTGRPDQRNVSFGQRHGKLLGLTSNSQTHAFSALLSDATVIAEEDGKEEIGAYRNFCIVEDFGEFHEGFVGFSFKPTEDEQRYVDGKKLLNAEGQLDFKHFVHPSLARGFTGARYLTTKLLEERVTDEKKHYVELVDHLYSSGVNLGGKRPASLPPIYSTEKRDFGPVRGTVLEAKVLHPGIAGQYPLVGKDGNGDVRVYSGESSANSKDVLRYALDHKKKLYQAQAQLRACVRAVEMAYFLHGFADDAKTQELRPGWDVGQWERDVRIGNGRNRYNALDFGDVQLLYRNRRKTVQQPLDCSK